MKEQNTIILLSACIDPNGMLYTKLVDMETRKEQYIKALHFYLKETTAKIVFVENTGYDLSSNFLKFIDEGRLEMITFNGNDYDRSLGKGYGEAQIVKYAVNNSKFIKSNSTIVKITGRHCCENIVKVINWCTNKKTVYAQLILDEKKNIMCDSRLFVAPRTFLMFFFLPFIEDLNDSKFFFFEHLLYRSSCEWVKCGNKFQEFIFPLKIKGVSGTSGITYKEDLNIISFYIKRYLHKFGYFGHLQFWKNSK